MRGFKYVVEKSISISTKLDLNTTPDSSLESNSDKASNDPSAPLQSQTSSSNNATSRHEGSEFLTAQHELYGRVLTRHSNLLQSGEMLSDELEKARKRLFDQVESERYLTQNFHHVTQVRIAITHLRALVQKIGDDIGDVENLLMQKTEEYMASQNASFVARQQQELENFEQQIFKEKEVRKRELLEERRRALAEAFQNDLKTYQALVHYQGENPSKALRTEEKESLESIELIVATDTPKLEEFYASESESDEEKKETRLQDENTQSSDQEPSTSSPQEQEEVSPDSLLESKDTQEVVKSDVEDRIEV